MPRSREEDIFKNTSILHYLPKITSTWGGWPWNLQFLVSLPFQCYISNLVKIGLVDVNGQRTMEDDRRQPITIGHLSDSGDLTNLNLLHSEECFVLKFGKNRSSSSGKKDLLILPAYSSYYLPLEKSMALHFSILESPSAENVLCQAWLKLAQWFWRTQECVKYANNNKTVADRQRTNFDQKIKACKS